MVNIGKMVKTIKRKNGIVLYRYEPWLLSHGDEAYPEWVVELIAEQLRTPPRDRSGSFSGASAGYCIRRQELAYAGVEGEPIDPQLRAIFNDGKFRHLRFQADMLTSGIVTDMEYLVKWPKHMSRGSLDCRGEVPQDHPKVEWRGLEFGLELKGVSSFQLGKYKSGGPDPKHIRQVHHYFVLGGFDLFVIIYEDKNTQEKIEWVIEPDEAEMKAALADIEKLSYAVRKKVLHPMQADCARKKGDWSSCPYGKNGKCLTAISETPSPFEVSM